MATKNLARTPLEAGNTPEFQYQRRKDRRSVRHASKAFCRDVLRDADEYEAGLPPPSSEVKSRSYPFDKHDDKLGAVSAWVAAQVGRRWDDVYRDIRRLFDTRTLAGWHIVSAHLPSDEDFIACGWRDGTYWAGSGKVYVDAAGVLRMQPKPINRQTPQYRRMRERGGATDEKFRRFLAGRKIVCHGDLHAGAYGARWFWLVPTGHAKIAHVEVRRPLSAEELLTRARNPRSSRSLYFSPWVDEVVARVCPTYRQDRTLTFEELEFFAKQLSEQQRKHAMDCART